MKRLMYLSHHWLGICVCLFMAMWFFSGVVMMYVQYPSLSPKERLSALPALQSSSIQHNADKLLGQLPKDNNLTTLRLTTVQNRPAYLSRFDNGEVLGQFADTGELFTPFTQNDAIASAQEFAKHLTSPSEKVQYLGKLDKDQWSITYRLNRYRPLHLLALNDSARTQVYVSEVTGAVVLDSNKKERFWNWLGANIHWFYPKVLRQHTSLWYWLVIVISCLALLSVFSGAVVGFWRLRIKKRYKKKHITPYKGQLKLHHILGLCFLLPVTTFTYSGIMSMGSFGVPKDKTSFAKQLQQYQGNTKVAAFKQQWQGLNTLKDQLSQFPETREIVWYWFDGRLGLYFLNQDNQRQLFQAQRLANVKQQALAQLTAILPNSPNPKIELLTNYNRYYYAHHKKPVLPVLRIQFNDIDQSWFYIHPETGELLQRQTTHSRTMRWLYHGLHRLDFPWLINNRPLWDITVILLSIIGLVFSISAVIIAWRYLRNPKKRKIKFFKPFHKTFKALRGYS